MNPMYSQVLMIVGMIGTFVLRASYVRRGQRIAVLVEQKRRIEAVLVALVFVSTFGLPLLSFLTPVFDFARYGLGPIPSLMAFIGGLACLLLYFWLFFRSHKDLGRNWSLALEIKEGHQLITGGVYSYVRHPMYAALFLYGVAQLLLIPNWFVGPSNLICFALLYIIRVEREERMMVEQFGDEYVSYSQRTKRLVPWLS